jgi:hypothetical protein
MASKTISKRYRFKHDDRTITVKGRECQTLDRLIAAGKQGITSLDHPGIRLAAYIFDLRRDFGILIQTDNENHGGEFAGSHARYTLVSEIECVGDEDARNAA